MAFSSEFPEPVAEEHDNLFQLQAASVSHSFRPIWWREPGTLADNNELINLSINNQGNKKIRPNVYPSPSDTFEYRSNRYFYSNPLVCKKSRVPESKMNDRHRMNQSGHEHPYPPVHDIVPVHGFSFVKGERWVGGKYFNRNYGGKGFNRVEKDFLVLQPKRKN